MATTPATWSLPKGHESVAAFATEDEASAAAREMVAGNGMWRYYIQDKRGAWEVIRRAA